MEVNQEEVGLAWATPHHPPPTPPYIVLCWDIWTVEGRGAGALPHIAELGVHERTPWGQGVVAGLG